MLLKKLLITLPAPTDCANNPPNPSNPMKSISKGRI